MVGKRGFSVFELLVTMALIMGVMTASISIFRQVAVGQNQLDMQSNFLVVRSNLMSLLRSSGSWRQTVIGAANAGIFGCLVKQDSLVAAERNCSLASQMVNVYDAKGRLFYDLQNPATGFSPEGNVCTTYAEAPGGTPDPQCPLRVNLNIRSLCTANPCENPAVEVVANFRYSSPNHLPLNFNHLNFRIVRSAFFCPDPPPGVRAMVVQGTGVTATAAQVTPTVTGKNFVTGSGHYSIPINSCMSMQTQFRYALGASDLNADTIPDAEGIARVCLVEEGTGVCRFAFEIHPAAGGSFNLVDEGGVVVTKPVNMILTSTTVLGFKVYNGRVQACFENNCFYSFSQKLNGPYNIEYRPASRSYSTGFNSIVEPVVRFP